MITNEKTKHLLFRAGFGPGLSDNTHQTTIRSWMAASSGNHQIDVVEKSEIDRSKMAAENRKALFQKSRQQVLKLNGAWIAQFSSPAIRFREKMTLFWHDHFACRIRAPFLVQQQNNVLREHALGSFRSLLMAVSKDPAMLQFLNNQQNKKNSPNENFAREVLELFTLGRGHYSEDDIKNGARAFTGWSFSPVNGKFLYRPNLHDNGAKVFKGKKGNFTGEDIINIILDDKQTARFITEKLWAFFVATGKPTENNMLDSLADRFYKSDYDISMLMEELFTSETFYDSRFRGNRIKSPIELIAGIMTQTGGTFENPQASLFVQRALSQILFFPPNVGGWPSGTSWIDSSSLTFRMSLPAVLLGNVQNTVEAKDDGDVNNVTNDLHGKKITFRVDWSLAANLFTRSTAAETLDLLEHQLLATTVSATNKKIVRNYASGGVKDPDFMKRAFVGYMSLPEYQLS